MMNSNPTTDPSLNAVLHDLVTSAQTILGENFLAAYLHGSFALGDWDVDSDVDFDIVIHRDLTDLELSALQALHGRLYELPPHWAQHLEGSYVPKDVLRRPGPERVPLYFLDNTSRVLERSVHDDTRVVRWMIRERGITLAGPPPKELIDPIDPEELKREVWGKMQAWAGEYLGNPQILNNRWDQPYAVLSYCRMLHTLATGQVFSKPKSARWAQAALDPRWSGLIERAWADRPNPSLKIRQPAEPEDISQTLEFIRYALEVSGRFWQE